MNSDFMMHQIIDELNPNYKPMTDEMLVKMNGDHGIYRRSFKHSNGSEFMITWTIYYGTPETVRTVFESVEEL